MTVIFDTAARRTFAENYPETPHILVHNMREHPLLTIPALAALGDALPQHSVEYNKADLPVGIDPEKVPANGLTIGETISSAQTNGSWAVLNMPIC
jgi:hypothetical protein